MHSNLELLAVFALVATIVSAWCVTGIAGKDCSCMKSSTGVNTYGTMWADCLIGEEKGISQY